MNRWHLAGTYAIRLFGGVAVAVGWAGVYYAFQGHRLGIVLALLATGITVGTVHVGDLRARAQNAALRDALASAAARNRELERLRRVAATLLAGSELTDLMQEIADAAVELLQVESGAVTLVVEEGRFLRLAAATGPLASAMGSLLPVDGSLLGAVVSGGTPIVTNDMNADPRSYRMPGVNVLLRTAAMVPLRSAGVVIGTVSVYNHRNGLPFTDHDLQLLETLGDQVVVGLDRAAVLEEIRRSERALAARNVELQRAARLKGEFLANMSHELRTPLNAIIGFSDLMLTEGVGPVSGQQREFLEAILRNGRHLLELISGILDLSKVDAGRMSLSLAPTDLLIRVAGLVAPHVALLAEHAARERDEPRVNLEPVQLLEISEVLALTQEPGQATRLVAELAGRFLPFDHLHFALRLTEGDRVVLLDPGERRAIPDLASVPVAGTALGEVLQGERPHYFALHQGEARLIAPLRVTGRVHGALVLTAAPPAVLNPAHIGPAQRVADLVAPHLELLRRAAMLPAPFHPGWKREHRR